MSEYIKSDAGEFITNRTMNFEKSPPDFVWNNIEKHIPVYSPNGTVSTLVKLVIGTMSLSVIIFAILWIKLENNSPASHTEGMAVNKKNTTQIPSISVSASSNDNIVVEKNKIAETDHKQNLQQITTDPENKQLTEPGKNITYSINASGLRNVTEISFVDHENKIVLSSKNPTPNSFGFYIIDVSQLVRGTYNIMITTNEGTRLHKKETFK
jgi:hypothetical protein